MVRWQPLGGAGIALVFVFTGLVAAVIGLSGYLFPAIRNVDSLLPDHDQMETAVPAGA